MTMYVPGSTGAAPPFSSVLIRFRDRSSVSARDWEPDEDDAAAAADRFLVDAHRFFGDLLGIPSAFFELIGWFVFEFPPSPLVSVS
jgi:hypothetical protein